MDWLNPFRWISPQEYKSIWEMVYYNIFHGFWARFIAFISLFAAIYIFIRRQNFILSLMFLLLSFIVTYFSFLVAK